MWSCLIFQAVFVFLFDQTGTSHLNRYKQYGGFCPSLKSKPQNMTLLPGNLSRRSGEAAAVFQGLSTGSPNDA